MVHIPYFNHVWDMFGVPYDCECMPLNGQLLDHIQRITEWLDPIVFITWSCV